MRQASIIGGSSDRDVTELAVMPNALSGVLVVTTVTPLGRCPTTWRNVSASNAAGPVVLEAITGTVLSGRRIGRVPVHRQPGRMGMPEGVR
ncbi:hypothetical protein GCM10010464_81900 [Pseudonocardia yunnanensis]